MQLTDTAIITAPDDKLIEIRAPESGEWNGQLIEDTLSMKIFEFKTSSANNTQWISSLRFGKRDIGINTLVADIKKQGNVRFDVKKEAGTVHFKVIVLNTNYEKSKVVQDAAGTYEFEENIAFRNYLHQNKFSDVSNGLMMLLFVTNTDRLRLRHLIDKGYDSTAKLENYLRSTLVNK
jgi:hypothetical protein